MFEKKIKHSKWWIKLENTFVDGTYESFLRHDFLLLSNIFLTITMIIELILVFGFDIEWEFFHKIDLFFGIIFLIEFFLKLYFILIPDRVFFKPFFTVNFIVIISLIWPHLFFNLAFLRIIRSLKVIKIYIYKKETEHDKKDEYKGILEIIKIANKTVWQFIFNKIKRIFKK